MSSQRLVCLLFLLISLECLAQKKPVTLESLAEVRPEKPKPAEIVWAPDGKSFVYEQGGSIWLYDVAARSKRELVPLSSLRAVAAEGPTSEKHRWQNRRVKEKTFQWSSSSDKLLIQAGGDLFLFRIEAGGWNQITSTPEAERDPKLAPDQKRVSFRLGHDLYSLEIASEKVTQLTHDGSDTLWNGELDWVYPEELELGTAHWWSPDSKRIAYLQFEISREPLYPHVALLPLIPLLEPQRYPKAGTHNADVRLGIVSPEGGRTQWLNLGETRDRLLARVYWAPDGKSILVEHLNRIQNRLELARVDVENGKKSVVLEEEDPYWINVAGDFRFLKDGKQFLWSSERDGFRHLYVYSTEGRQLAQLTRGDWEVTDVAGVNESSGDVFFVSTQQSPLERQLYRVRLDGSDLQRITQTPGTHSISMAPTGEFYMDTFSNLTTPPSRILYKSDGAEWAVFVQADKKLLDEYEILPTEIIEVKAPDGALLNARLIRPAGFQQGRKYPAIVDVYGGPHAQTVRDLWAGPDWDQVMAQRGFVIWQLDNRGSAGRGHRWESVIFRHFGEKELEDQKEGVRHLISMGFVDPERIGITGWSFGGFMTLYALLHEPDLFRAGIAGAPVTDWRNYDTIYTERYMGLPSENPEGYRHNSPVNYAGELKAKLLLIHNLEDDNVLFQNTAQMANELELAEKQFELMVYPGKAHAVTGAAENHMRELRALFFEKHLKR